MILNHSKTIRNVISLLCISIMVSCFTVCTTPACFSTFYQCAMVPTLVENSCTCLLTFFVNNYYDW